VPLAKPINALNMEAVIDVQTASLGQILAVVQRLMMDIVQPVSNKCFPKMNEAKLYTHTQRKSGFAMQLMPVLKDSYMTCHYILDNATARIGDALIIGN
jgi:hypothetical protein